MWIEVKGHQVNYQKNGEHGKDVILLHGWGQNTQMMQPIANYLENGFIVYNLDFPGFGESQKLKEPWGVEEYTDFLNDFIIANAITNPIIIAHSFGARVALLYASKYDVYKLVLTGAAGIRPKRGLGYYSKLYSYKFVKRALLLLKQDKLVAKYSESKGSDDYKSLSSLEKQSFVKIVNLDLTPVLKDIKAETLLVWGENDEATPLWMGKKMEELIKNSGLAVFSNQGHYAYWYEMNRFLSVIEVFLKKDRYNNGEN